MKLLLSLFLILSVPCLVFGLSPQLATKASQIIDQREMEQILNDYLADKSDSLPHVELRFKSMTLPEPYHVPQGRVKHQVIPTRTAVIGSRRLTLLTRVDGQIASNQSVRVELEALAEIAISSTALRRGEILDPGNIELQTQDISRLKDPIFSTEEIFGKRLKRSIRLGEALQRKQVEFPPLIKRGERVVIHAQKMGLTLSAAGEAKQDGQAGESIRVMNSNSRKEVLCQVVAPGLVKVEF